MAQNDWLVAGLNNPTFTTQDFVNIADLTTANTQLLSRDDYLKSDFIKNHEAFKDDNGQFSEQKFNNYYNARAQDFGEFQRGEYTRGPALDMFSIFRTVNTPVQAVNFNISRGVNPDRQAIGIEGVNVWSDPTLSRREIAKQNKVYDTKAGKFRDYSVNDHTLVTNPAEWLKDVFKEPLVLATWDEDGTHQDPITGITVEHKKGEEKLNDKGTYYYETLGNRSTLGKDVLSVFDTFTVDGKGINKYDFFDSNDIKKSAAGTVAKTVATLVPLFAGSTVAGMYALFQISKEFSKSMPMLAGMVTSLTDSRTPDWVNNIAMWGEKLSMSSSDYARQNTFATENIGNLIAEVACQWGQQQGIAQFFNKIRGTNKYMLEAEQNVQRMFNAKKAEYIGREADLMEICRNKFIPAAQKLTEEAGAIGRNTSLAYMAVVSNTDVYQDMLEHGATKSEAAAVALGSTLGMYAVDKYLHLGELFFDEATPDVTKQARQAIRNEVKKSLHTFDAIKQTDVPVQNKLLQYIRKASDVTKSTLNKFNEDLTYHTLGFGGKALGEGLEEVAEELVADASKSMYQLAGYFGFDTSTTDVGAWDNAFDRYAMNFLGGAIGGSVFYGKQVWDGHNFRRPKADEDMANLIRNGHADELRRQVQTMYDEGYTGNKHLLYSDPIYTKDGEFAWRTTDNEAQSQAAFVRDQINTQINALEEILIGNQANMSDDQLFENMILAEDRYRRYQNIAPVVDIYQDHANVLNELIEASKDYHQSLQTMNGEPQGNIPTTDRAESESRTALSEDAKRQREENRQKVYDRYVKAREKYRNFLSGNNSLEYIRKLNFAIDPVLHTPYLDVSEDEYFKTQYPDKEWKELTPEEQLRFKFETYPAYVNNQLKTKLKDAWAKFKTFEAKVDPHLEQLSKSSPEYKAWFSKVTKLFEPNGALSIQSLFKQYKTAQDKLDTESDEDYENRDKPIINPTTGVIETTEEFNARQRKRNEAIIAYNDEVDKKWVDNVTSLLSEVGMRVDPMTARALRTVLDMAGWDRTRSVINRKIELGTSNPILRGMLKNLAPDLSNADEILNGIAPSIITGAVNTFNPIINNFNNTELTLRDGQTMSLADFYSLLASYQEQGFTFQDMLEDIENYKSESLAKMEEEAAGENPVTEGVTEPTDFDETAPATPETSETVPELDFETGSVWELLTPESLGDFEEALQDFATNAQFAEVGYDALNTPISDVTEGMFDFNTLRQKVTEATKSTVDPLLNQASSIIESIRRNPVLNFRKTLNSTIKNPIGELIKAVAESNKDELPDVDAILNLIQDDFENLTDAHQLELDETQKDALMKVKNYLQMLRPYLYAAATVPSKTHPIGHNKTINSFAESHKDKLVAPWDKLPEIDSDFVALYLRSIENYINEIDAWIKLSDSNTMQKTQKFIRVESALNKSLFDVLSSIPRTLEVAGKKVDILNGIDQIDTTQLTSEDGMYAQVPLYELERLLYRNVKKLADENKMTITDLLTNSDLLKSMIPDIEKAGDQRSTAFTDTMTKDTMTPYTKLQYLAAVLSEDPVKFFSQLNKRVNENEKIAPITIQEFDTRIAQGMMSPTFRSIVAFGRTLMTNQETSTLENTVVIPGVAGAGKTQVLLMSIDAPIKDKPVIIAAPTEKQAKSMKDAMSRNNSSTFKQALISILGEAQYESIKSEFENAKDTEHDGKYYSARRGSDGLIKVTLKADAIKFNESAEKVAAIYLDEATHLSTVEAMIFDAYAKQIGAVVYMLGDPCQLGYMNTTNEIQNIDEGAMFAVRVPALNISLRDNNIQKHVNQNAVRELLDNLLYDRLYSSDADFGAKFPSAQNIYSHFNFRVYNETELTGDMITKDLSDNVLQKLKAAFDAKKTIAFIGDPTSAHLQKLKNAGINIAPEDVLNLRTMQGQEYDYVVIDQEFTTPESTSTTVDFLRKLYTLMTRSRTASIFVSPNLSSIIGNNVYSEHTAMAPSIADGVAELRKRKIDVLKKLDLSETAAKEPVKKPKTEAEKDETTDAEKRAEDTKEAEEEDIEKDEEKEEETESTYNPEDFNDPDKANRDAALIKAVRGLENEDKQSVDKDEVINSNITATLEDFPIECYGDAWFTGAEVVRDPTQPVVEGEDENKNANKYQWRVSVPQEGELRNLQALMPLTHTGSEPAEVAQAYVDKIALQKRLIGVRSAIKFDHPYSSMAEAKFPPIIVRNFTQEAWEAGTFELEFRIASDIDNLPIHSPFKERGMAWEINGQEVRLIANIVFRAVNKNGRVCKFDIAGINSPITLESKKAEIKTNFENKIAKYKRTAQSTAQNQATIDKLQFILDNIDTAVIDYKNWFANRITEFEQALARGESYSLNVTDAVTSSKTTWFTKRKGGPIRLGEHIDPTKAVYTYERDKKTGEIIAGKSALAVYEENVNNLKDQNPDKVFSPIYTFADKNGWFDNVDTSLRGRAVVFVSDDTLLNENELINYYINQKTNPGDNTPVVRMLVLDNYGLTFSQLHDVEFISRFQKGEEDRKPFRQNFTGIRMLTSLWNTRAALIKFNEALAKWKVDNNLSDEQVDTIIKVQDEIYNKEAEAAEAEAKLRAVGLDMTALDKLTEFNDVYCKDIPMFRLGYTRHVQGFHIQQFKIPEDSLAYDSKDPKYNDGMVSLCVINPFKAGQFRTFVDGILNTICPTDIADAVSEKELYSLKTTFQKEITVNNPDGTTSVTVEPWEKSEFIDLNNETHRRSLSGYLAVSGQTISLTTPAFEGADENQTVKLTYSGGTRLSIIPRLISKIARTVTFYQFNDEAKENGFFGTMTFIDKGGHESEYNKEDQIKLHIALDNFFVGDYALKRNFDAIADEKTARFDTSLFDMMNLIFHGTTEDIHRPRKKGTPPIMQMEDAYFKNGFEVNPDVAREYNANGKPIPIEIKSTKGTALFYKLSISPALLTADVDMHSSNMQLSLRKLMDITTATPQTTVRLNPTDSGFVEVQKGPSQKELEFKEKHPQAFAKFTGATDIKSLEAAVNNYNRNMADTIARNFELDSQAALDMDVYFDLDNDRILTFRGYLEQRYPGYVFSVDETGTIIAAGPDNKTLWVDLSTLELIQFDSAKLTATLDDKGTTLGSYLLKLVPVDNEDFVKGLAENTGVSKETLQNFVSELQELVGRAESGLEGTDQTYSDSDLDEQLINLWNAQEYSGIRDYITNLYSDDPLVQKMCEILINC